MAAKKVGKLEKKLEIELLEKGSWSFLMRFIFNTVKQVISFVGSIDDRVTVIHVHGCGEVKHL